MAERRIGDRVFKVVPLPASEALELYAETLRIAGHGAGRLPALLLSASAEEEGSASAMGHVALLMAVADVLNGNAPAVVRDLLRRLVEVAMIQRPGGHYEQVDLDHDFTGRLGEIVPVIKFVLAEQFSDFFIGSGASGILKTLREALAKQR